MINILYIYESLSDLQQIKKMVNDIEDRPFSLEGVQTFEEIKDRIFDIDLFLVDLRLGKISGIDLIKELKTILPQAGVILLQEQNHKDVDYEALTLGVSDYLIKGAFSSHDLNLKIRYALRDSQLIESLNLAAEKFSSIFEKAEDPFLMIDSIGKILEANPKFIQKVGLDPHLLDVSHEVFFSELILEKQAKDYFTEELGKNSETFEFQTKLQKKEGKPFLALVRVTNQNPSIFQVLIKDLTALKEKEEEEYYLKKFSSAGRIARILAHEVKNPLTTIVLSADQLQMELPKEVLNESGDLIEVIQRNCNRINELVTELLNSTRFSELQLKKQSINTVLDSAIDQVKDRIELSKVQVVKDYEESIAKIAIDETKIEIALSNLIVNAIEAMEGTQGQLHLKTYCDEKYCRVEITDNGEGISKENMERLFEPYYTSKSTGTGLGLTNTQNIILSHGGSIRAESEIGKGTTFFINFKLSS